MNFIPILIIAFFICSFGNPIDSLKPGEWYQVPNSRMSDVDPCPARNCAYSGTSGQSDVIAGWCGGAFDTKRNQLIVYGGGHAGYAGNEVYAFNLDSLKWIRLTNPSSLTGLTGCGNLLTADSQPISRHTYAGMEYIESADMVLQAGGFTWPCAYGDPYTWFFDYSKNKWIRGANLGFGSRAMVAYDPVSGHVWCMGGSPGFNEYDPVTKKWTPRNRGNFGGQIITVDPENHWLVGLNRGNISYYPINGNTGAVATYNTSGDTAVINAAMPDGDYCTPGFVWDPIIKKFVAWNGGAYVYTLDAVTHSFTRVLPAATNKVIPTAACSRGTYGRFRYSPKSNVYVVVNSTTENVFVYRMASSGDVSFERTVESVKDVKLSVKPNPVNRTGQITISGNFHSGTVAIYDITGKVVYTSPVSQQATRWKIPRGINPGMYIARLSDKRGVVKSCSFMLVD